MEDTLATISAMRHQEDTGYLTADFLHQHEPPAMHASGPLHQAIDVDCRTKMAAWCYQVVDFCKFHRETVEIAMSYLDRYMCSPAGARALGDRAIYQLAAMTALYTAVKIHEPEAMDPKLVSSLSRGTYSAQQVEEMEACMLPAVQWRLNPPTSLAFVRMFLELIPEDVLSQRVKDAAYELTKYQSELAVCEYDFIAVKASTVAFCSLMNSLECLNVEDKVLGYLGFILAQAIGIDCNNEFVVAVQNRLYEAVVNQPHDIKLVKAAPAAITGSKGSERRSSIELSPRSIAGS